MSLLTSIKAFSQKATLSEKDTVICFTIPQSKYLLKKYYQAEELLILDSICEAQLSVFKDISSSNERVIKNQSLVLKNKDEEVRLKELEIGGLNELINDKEKEIATQKLYKWIAITSTIIVTCLIAF